MVDEALFARFRETLRQHLIDLPESREIDLDLRLQDAGLDSLETVSLIVDLEDELGVLLPDDALIPSTFETAGTLWDALQIALDEE